MVNANKTSLYCWQYQAAVGTSIITAVNSVSYYFGVYNDKCGKWNSPFSDNPAEPHWVYSSRTPTLTDLDREFPTFGHVFLPTTIQFLAWMLGNPTNTTPTVTVATPATGLTYPLTVRFQEDGGSANVPQNAQAVDCYCVGLTCVAERGTQFLVETEFAWGAFEDIGDNANLTTAPLVPGNLLGEPYNGNPILQWDSDGDNVNIPSVWRAQWNSMQKSSEVEGNGGTTKTNYTNEMEPVRILLSAVFQLNDGWDDYFHRKANTNMTIQIKKYDSTSYITFTFTNCRILSIKKTGARNKGHYGSECALLAEKVEGVGDWFTEGGANFSTHFKATL